MSDSDDYVYDEATGEWLSPADAAAAKAVLERQIPDVLANPRIGVARGMTLQALQSYVPSLTTEKLRAIDAALAGVAVPAASAADE